MTDFQSAADVFTKLQLKDNPVGLATVYRNLAALADEGILDTGKVHRRHDAVPRM
ncbi:transcriptional repressor [Mobiluncus curtisii]|uniref:transcriptional repressor n=1 Tax=Mobiluncus curtisii TaxID=2051 RepID=UPI002093983C|nr:transcriptional repressor [Mobiluncus curtisii]